MRRRAPRVLLLSTLSIAVATTGLSAGAAPARNPSGDAYGVVWNILPPGSSGNVDATDLLTIGPSLVAVDGENAPENFADQLEMYDKLTTFQPYQIGRGDLDTLFKRSTFAPAEVVRAETPRDGVTIEWDAFGVPYVTGETHTDVMFGSGYAAVMDRMFLMDALRHTGAGKLASFAGATPGNLAMDAGQYRSAFYTQREAAEQIRSIAERYGSEGQQLVNGVDAYLLGLNAGQDALCPSGLITAPTCPVEYTLLGQTVTPWLRSDIVYIASLVGGIFGRGGGGELENAYYLQKLEAKFGPAKGRALFADLRTKYDGDAPSTASVGTWYGGGAGLGLGRSGVALPDLAAPTAAGSGTLLSSSPALSGDLADVEPSMDLPGGSFDLSILKHGMSNALLVGADQSTNGHPVTVFGPQTSYFTPQLLNEQVLMGPGIYARGVSFAGTNVVVELGRGVDYAWSATSASLDNVDTVVERLCNMDGSPATIESEAYLVGGVCRPMRKHTPSQTALPSAGWQGEPTTYTFLVLRTRHGIVQTRTSVNGKPVAVVAQRSTYGHEIDSAVGFARFNNPDYMRNAKSFLRAAQGIDYTFNWFYADDRDIAYYASGLVPKRSDETSFDFPRWGDRRYDWQGWVPFKGHVREINPDRGYLVSWNNRQSPRWAAPDNIWAWGSVHRSDALED
jgi:acyl-homoserine lactone acylase PvdQ